MGADVRLQGKRCLIVGGTSGIGLAAAARFVEEGARLVIAGPDAARGEAAKAALGAAHFLRCDATVSADVAELFAGAVSLLGGLDVLYHVAGGSGRRFGDGSLHECSEDGWDATLALNLTSAFLTNRAMIRHLLARHAPGVILNLASVLALDPSPRYFDTAAYAAAKGGLIAMSRQAAARYAPDGIRANVLAPGLTDTPTAARAVGDPAIQAYLRVKQPLAGGPGRAEDCAGAAVFLCSDEARLVTGAVLAVDAGWGVSDATV
jgi:NAD(P)-dependent dehydrogenase (short-subunit alcohol dehydrogenase family)